MCEQPRIKFNHSAHWRFGFLIFLFLPVLSGCQATDAKEIPFDSEIDQNATVVLELFTSQGCSSCPPADHLLKEISEDERLRGKVIPLSFHVDYWNYIGWRDPFSKKEWSQRQHAYANAFSSKRVYTPQLVVNGNRECVGSKRGKVFDEIGHALSQAPHAQIQISPVHTQKSGETLSLEIQTLLTEGIKSRELEVMVAVFENDLVTAIKSGENARRTLKNNAVVRRLDRAYSISSQAKKPYSGFYNFKFDSEWKKENIGVAVFLQDPASMEIWGAAVLYYAKLISER